MKTEKKKLEALKVVSFVVETLDNKRLAKLRGGVENEKEKLSTDDTIGDALITLTVEQKECVM